jgi:hypothetical protein
MATPVKQSIRALDEGMLEGQARIIAGAFEQLDRRLCRIEIISVDLVTDAGLRPFVRRGAECDAVRAF